MTPCSCDQGLVRNSALAARRFLAVLALSLLAVPAWAIDYLSAGETAVIFDAPSNKAKPQRIIARGTPAERVVVVGAWVKIRDPKGGLGWVEKAQLAEQRTVMVRQSGRAQVRSDASESATMVFEAEPDVLLELIEAGPAGWARVRHADGQSGFVKAAQVWGL
ncbi:MAG: hypothetical protein IPH08_02290 [Rhodocyclaceae bacterium]|nr:hypothetical protein [Rhodocyclaceae bacterium]MBK6905996.1 hypothetical protein [Rhodocyclaceae bacterium]